MNALFDLDGTLCDPREGILHGFRHAFDVLRRPCPPETDLVALIGQPLAKCFRSLGLQAEACTLAAHHFQAFFEGRGFAEARLYDGVLPLLRGLQQGGWGLAIASAKPTFAVRFVAQGLGILPYFDGLYGCAPDDLSPTKTPIVAAALADRGWPAAESVMIGDRDQDRDAARAHGLRFIGAQWGFGSARELDGAWALAQDIVDLERLLRAAPWAEKAPIERP